MKRLKQDTDERPSSGAQQLLEERVVAVAARRLRELLDERVRTREPGERTGGESPTQLLDQTGPQHLHDAGPEEGVPHLLRLGVQDLGQEVLGDVARIAAQVGKREIGLETTLESDRRETQASNPSAGSVGEAADRIWPPMPSRPRRSWRQIPAAHQRPSPVRRGHRPGLQTAARGRTWLARHKTDPHLRPVHHRLEDRIRAHITLCWSRCC